MLFVEPVGLVEIAAAENLRVRIAEQLFTEQSANRVIDRIADNGGNHHQRHHQVNVEIVGRQRRQRAGHKQQRVARQERRHHQPGFAEQDQKQNGVDPYAVLGNKLGKVHINVQDKINQKANQFHSRLTLNNGIQSARNSGPICDCGSAKRAG